MLHAADDAHRPPLHGFAAAAHLAAAARAAPGTDGRTDRRTRHRFNTLAVCAVRVVILTVTLHVKQ